MKRKQQQIGIISNLLPNFNLTWNIWCIYSGFFCGKRSHVEHKNRLGAEEGGLLWRICCRSRMLDHHYIFVGGLHGSESIKISRSTQPDSVSLSLLVMWICNRGGYINHVVNDHRWWIGESWKNIYVGLQELLSRGGFQSFMETRVKKGVALTENDPSRKLTCTFNMYCFSNILKSSSKNLLNESKVKSALVLYSCSTSNNLEWWLLQKFWLGCYRYRQKQPEWPAT